MLIPVQVTFRNMDTEAGLEQLVQQEAAKLEHYYHRISSCRVVVERPQRAPSSKIYRVRIDLGVPNGELVVEHDPTLHAALKDVKVEKTRKEADAVLLHKNPKRAIHDAFQQMKRRLQDYRRKQEGNVKPTQRMPQAIVKDLFPDKGYGFLETSDNREIYFNQASVLNGHFHELRPGSRVRFAEEAGEKGPQGSTVRAIPHRKAG